MRKAEVLIILLLMTLAGGVGYQARGIVDGHLVWLDTPIVVANDAPQDAAVCICPELWTLSHIAITYYPDKNVQETITAILAANPDLDPQKLRIGQVVVLP